MALHKTNSDSVSRIRQGDIFPSIPYYESYREESGEFALTIYEFPYVVILTQDCDLEQNVTCRSKSAANAMQIENDKHLISVIVAPLYNAEHLFSGEHLSELGISTQRFNSGLKGPVKSNQNARYHYIEFGEASPLPNSIIDFKHYFTISLNYLESSIKNRVCGLEPIYRELVSQRFSNYLSRIGLPD